MLRVQVFIWGDAPGAPSYDMGGVRAVGGKAEYADYIAVRLSRGQSLVLTGANAVVVVPASAVRSVALLPGD